MGLEQSDLTLDLGLATFLLEGLGDSLNFSNPVSSSAKLALNAVCTF